MMATIQRYQTRPQIVEAFEFTTIEELPLGWSGRMQSNGVPCVRFGNYGVFPMAGNMLFVDAEGLPVAMMRADFDRTYELAPAMDPRVSKCHAFGLCSVPGAVPDGFGLPCAICPRSQPGYDATGSESTEDAQEIQAAREARKAAEGEG